MPIHQEKDWFAYVANMLFGWVSEQDFHMLETLKRQLIQSDLNFLFRTYVSQMCLSTIVVYGLFVFSTIGVSVVLQLTFSQALVIVSLIPLAIALSTFFFFLYYPQSVVKQRSADIERNLPFALNHMSAVLSSGLPPSAVFRLIQEFDEYGEIAKEARKIYRRIKLLGEDVVTAMREVSRATPSDTFREILYGTVSTLETGGDLRSFFREKAQESLRDYKLAQKKWHEKLSLYSTIYMSLLMAAPLFIIVILSVINVLNNSFLGFAVIDLLRISVYGVVPVLNIMFLGLLQVLHKGGGGQS